MNNYNASIKYLTIDKEILDEIEFKRLLIKYLAEYLPPRNYYIIDKIKFLQEDTLKVKYDEVFKVVAFNSMNYERITNKTKSNTNSSYDLDANTVSLPTPKGKKERVEDKGTYSADVIEVYVDKDKTYTAQERYELHNDEFAYKEEPIEKYIKSKQDSFTYVTQGMKTIDGTPLLQKIRPITIDQRDVADEKIRKAAHKMCIKHFSTSSIFPPDFQTIDLEWKEVEHYIIPIYSINFRYYTTKTTYQLCTAEFNIPKNGNKPEIKGLDIQEKVHTNNNQKKFIPYRFFRFICFAISLILCVFSGAFLIALAVGFDLPESLIDIYKQGVSIVFNRDVFTNVSTFVYYFYLSTPFLAGVLINVISYLLGLPLGILYKKNKQGYIKKKANEILSHL